MKAMTGIFWAAVGGVAISLVGAIVTVVKEKQEREVPHPIVTPATLPAGTR